MGLYDKLLKSFTNSFDNRNSSEVNEMRKEPTMDITKEKRAADINAAWEWRRIHADSDQKARAELEELLGDGPIDAANVGHIRSKYDIPKPIGAWIATYKEFMKIASPSNPGRLLYILTAKEKDPDYFARLAAPKPLATTRSASWILSGKSFFVGTIRSNTSKFGCERYVVSNVVLPEDREAGDISLSPSVVQSGSLRDGEFVVGCNAPNVRFVFFNKGNNAPVQVVLWTSFEESDESKAALQYFEENPSGRLTARFRYLIGNPDFHGIIVIRDSLGDSLIKGFISRGDGIVEYSGVEVFKGSLEDLYAKNQVREFKYRGNEFAILVPEKHNQYVEQGKHSVLDCEGWEPLESAKGKTGGDSLVQKEEEMSPLVVGDGRRDKSVTPSEGEAVGGAVADGFDDSVSGESLLNQQGERVTVSATAQKKSSLDEVGHIVSNERVSSVMNERDTSELAFLDWFKAYVKRCGFVFEDRDLVRFHTSVKAGMCTLLAGDPGSGKSSLAELYSRALAGKGNEEPAFRDGFCRVDVNPSWMEPADLLGYYEGDGTFKPAINGLYGYLREVQGGANMAMVCMEEINLARVEHYFSDFIQLFSRGYGHEIKGYDVKDKGGLLVGDNVLFVGTCNADESTQMMSNRFYDRVNLLEFHIDVEKAKSLLATAFAGTVAQIKPYEEGERISQDRYRSWSSLDWRPTIPSQVLKAFEALAEKLEAAELMPSGRVIGEMSRYIRLRPMYGCATDDERQMCALDEQIAQRVLARTQIGPNTSAVLKGLSEDLAEKGLKLSAKMLKFKVNAYERMISF